MMPHEGIDPHVLRAWRTYTLGWLYTAQDAVAIRLKMQCMAMINNESESEQTNLKKHEQTNLNLNKTLNKEVWTNQSEQTNDLNKQIWTNQHDNQSSISCLPNLKKQIWRNDWTTRETSLGDGFTSALLGGWCIWGLPLSNPFLCKSDISFEQGRCCFGSGIDIREGLLVMGWSELTQILEVCLKLLPQAVQVVVQPR